MCVMGVPRGEYITYQYIVYYIIVDDIVNTRYLINSAWPYDVVFFQTETRKENEISYQYYGIVVFIAVNR